MLWRPARRKGGTPDCLSAAVHGPQASGAGPGEGRGGGRDLLLPILLLLFRGCRHALAMTKALSWGRYFCSTFHSNSGVSVSNNESTVLRFRHHSLNCHSLVIWDYSTDTGISFFYMFDSNQKQKTQRENMLKRLTQFVAHQVEQINLYISCFSMYVKHLQSIAKQNV